MARADTVQEVIDWLLAEGHITEADLVGAKIVVCSRGGDE
ncbi:hypothetical protein W823_19130 [Williamsia sp. D3]|nr:hypothetical protein W823_19130 [Williamsia sp. D3]